MGRTGTVGLGTSPAGFAGATGLGGQTGTATITTTSVVVGGSSAGIRRAPAYYTALAPDLRTAERSAASLRPDLQAVIDRSSRLPSRGNIRVLSSGDAIVLRGQ